MKNKVYESTLLSKLSTERYMLPLFHPVGYEAQWRIGDDAIWTEKLLSEYEKWGSTNGRIRETDPNIGSGLLLEVFPTSKPDLKKLFQPWVRDSDKKLIPRFHLPSLLRESKDYPTDEDKIVATLNLTKCFDIHFLALIHYYQSSRSLIWLDAYHSVPPEWWKLVRQNRDGRKGRMEIKGKYQHKGQWKKLDDLKIELDRIFNL